MRFFYKNSTPGDTSKFLAFKEEELDNAKPLNAKEDPFINWWRKVFFKILYVFCLVIMEICLNFRNFFQKALIITNELTLSQFTFKIANV